MANKRINDLPDVPAPAATARIAVDALTTGSTQLGAKVAGLLAGTANSLAIADTNGLQAALDSKLSGTVPATSGGTGQVSYAVGDLLYAASTTTLAKLAAVATGNVLISGGVDTAPSWGKVGLTTHVDGILPVASGGSGRNTATAYAVLCGGTTSTGAHQSIAGVGSSGQVLTSNGAGALPTFEDLPPAADAIAAPGSSTDNAAVRFDGTSGGVAQNSALIIADTTAALSRSGGGGVPVQGTNTNDNATAGYVGETISNTRASGSAQGLTPGTAANVTSVALTAGDWLITGSVIFNAGTTATRIEVSIDTASATVTASTTPGYSVLSAGLTAGDPSSLGVSPFRVSLAGSQTYYLNARLLGTGSPSAFGTMTAVRIR